MTRFNNELIQATRTVVYSACAVAHRFQLRQQVTKFDDWGSMAGGGAWNRYGSSGFESTERWRYGANMGAASSSTIQVDGSHGGGDHVTSSAARLWKLDYSD
ncbi:hypothetical protein ACFX2I_016953 [Malus domestica]